MPSLSQAQHGAMEAAAHGHSTLGIPAKVGKDFVDADKARGTKKLSELVKRKRKDTVRLR
jgi:hypothetical protein